MDPVRVGDLAPGAWFEVLEAAWVLDGLVPSVEEPRSPYSGMLPFEIEEGL